MSSGGIFAAVNQLFASNFKKFLCRAENIARTCNRPNFAPQRLSNANSMTIAPKRFFQTHNSSCHQNSYKSFGFKLKGARPVVEKSYTRAFTKFMDVSKSTVQFYRYQSAGSTKVVFMQTFGSKVGEKMNDIVHLLLKQCNAIAAHRLRRLIQTFNLYSKLGYDQQSFRCIISRLGLSFRHQVHQTSGKAGKPMFMLFAAAAFNWEENNIKDDDLEDTAEEMGLIHRTSISTSAGTMGIDSGSTFLIGWEKVMDQTNMVAYRKLMPNSTHLYEYKVFGTFNDIPARAFYNAQMDLEFRKQWDRLVISLDVVARDKNSGTEVVHWITHFPYPMYQREYVYVRRAMIDQKRKVMVIVNRNIEHPDFPVSPKYVRVGAYKSQMVIQPHSNSFDELGFDYVLTYHDDPQAPFPGFAYKWMAQKGVPDFVAKLHAAATKIYKKQAGVHKDRDKSDRDKSDRRSPI